MTPHYIAEICHSKLFKIDITSNNLETNGVFEYNTACTLLEECILRYFLTFEVTDLVYTYAKDLCEAKNKFENWYRVYGWAYNDRYIAFKEWGGNVNRLHKKIVDGKFVIPNC